MLKMLQKIFYLTCKLVNSSLARKVLRKFAVEVVTLSLPLTFLKRAKFQESYFFENPPKCGTQMCLLIKQIVNSFLHCQSGSQRIEYYDTAYCQCARFNRFDPHFHCLLCGLHDIGSLHMPYNTYSFYWFGESLRLWKRTLACPLTDEYLSLKLRLFTKVQCKMIFT